MWLYLYRIKRRFVDIVKIMIFCFQLNFGKCLVCAHMHLKLSKSANMTNKYFFLKIFHMGIKKRRIFLPYSTVARVPASVDVPAFSVHPGCCQYSCCCSRTCFCWYTILLSAHADSDTRITTKKMEKYKSFKFAYKICAKLFRSNFYKNHCNCIAPVV